MLGKISQQKILCEARLKLTLKETGFVPNIEKLAKKYNLDETEKLIILILVGFSVSVDIKNKIEKWGYNIEISKIIEILSANLEEKINLRKYFYKNSNLVKSEILLLDMKGIETLEKLEAKIDPRMLDYILGLEREASELVEGSIIYSPKVNIENVILPLEQKELIVNTVENFEAYQNLINKLDFEEVLPYGKGLVILFYGPSGTGKTMMANALAKHLGKKIFVINFPKLREYGSGEVLRMIFREAKLKNCLLFFDECEQLFKVSEDSKDRPSEFLTEIEKYDGILIMATNKPSIMDEAIQRRINLAVEFRMPDQILRERIWEIHMPKEKGYLSEDIDIRTLAKKYELSGGFIKNAILMALSLAVSRDVKNPKIKQEDLEEGAKLQLVSRLKLIEQDHKNIADHGIELLVLPEKTMEKIKAIIEYEKATNVLFGQWGFDEKGLYKRGSSAIFYGPPGTGKTLTAEAIAYELGRPLRVVNTSAIISKYVGDTSKNLENIFKEAEGVQAVLVFDDAESFFGKRTDIRDSVDRYANIDVATLLYYLENFSGVVILTTNRIDMIDEAFHRRFKFAVEFPMPDKDLRKVLWEKLLPAKLPISQDLDIEKLANKYNFTGGQIRNTIIRASALVAVKEEGRRILTMEDLEKSAEAELRALEEKRIGF